MICLWNRFVGEEAVYYYKAEGEVDRGGTQQVPGSPKALWEGMATHRRCARSNPDYFKSQFPSYTIKFQVLCAVVKPNQAQAQNSSQLMLFGACHRAHWYKDRGADQKPCTEVLHKGQLIL
ncbi:hypothetical protein GW17_00060704 [Ensete ventricosum]|uniref:Uncharacterized protein n=1 Tax=Ensete ventricosum TaxID=4639 RepID=A0A426ZAY5_ENSVE|nr:hypothetical protein B296_00006681 [Ensete ventricosum]RWV78342.1 hypothetical protein GW17_00060704 [Ensete ventricosum]